MTRVFWRMRRVLLFILRLEVGTLRERWDVSK